MKLTSGQLFTTIGWLLTADAIIGAFSFIAVWQSVEEFGGRFPPYIIYLLMFPLVVTGGFVTFYGARQVRRRNGALAMLFPFAAIIMMLVMLQLLACVPWALCTAP